MLEGNIHPELVQVALEKVEGFAFERFANDFLSVLEGRDFIPLGGVKDGGADGLYECGNGRSYYQFTRQENHRDKIRKTSARLIEFGRNAKTIYYFTSRLIPHVDKEEDLLSEELDVAVKIKDRKYIMSHINDSNGTIAAYTNNLAVYTKFLERVGKSDESFPSASVNDPTAYVFLQHEVINRLGDRKLIHSLTDSMLLWALSDTDPDKGIFMTAGEISERIFERFPWASKLLKSHISKRLEVLRTKTLTGREVRWHRKENKYCLPFETRKAIKAENQTDEALKIRFIEELKVMASDCFDEDDGKYQKMATLSDNVIHKIFEKQGLLLAHFLSSEEKDKAPPVVSDCIDEALETALIKNQEKEIYRDYIENIIQKVFFHSSPTQRAYLTNLSRTYVLLFTLQVEPRIIEYFSTMSASFRLYLGSDILIKALSERYLLPEDQVARNLLKMSSQAGISLYLSECVLEEIYTHIRGTYFEFLNYFADIEPYITNEIARNSQKILIRSYFYAKKDGLVKSWKAYLGQFLSYHNIDRPEGREELRKYLLSEYKLGHL